jgi:hypothetical protein
MRLRNLSATRRTTVLLGLLAAVAPSGTDAQATAPAPARPSADWLITADWLQAGALSIDRSTMPSASVALQRRTERVASDFGYLRTVRAMSTVQGAYGTLGRILPMGAVTTTVGLGLFLGQVQASADTSGYIYVTGGQTGYQPRFTHSSGFAIGTGVHATFALSLGKSTEVRATVAEWAFTGKPIERDNARFLAGAGLAFRLPRDTFGAKTARGND